MKASSNLSGKKNRHPLWAIAAILLLPALLTGCARPGEAEMNRMMGEVYECKWLEMTDFKKTDSLPGIWSYVAQYDFKIKFKDGEQGALNFNKGLFAAMPQNEKDPKAALKSQQVQDYIKTECSEPGQSLLNQLADDVLNQLDDKKGEALLPVVAPMSGWAEFVSAKKGWTIEVRREKIKGSLTYSEPVKWEQLSPKAAALVRKGSKQ